MITENLHFKFNFWQIKQAQTDNECGILRKEAHCHNTPDEGIS